MRKAVSIEPSAIYDGVSLRDIARLGGATLANARRSGRLRFTKQGNRILYLGQWVLDYLDADSRQGVMDELVRLPRSEPREAAKQ